MSSLCISHYSTFLLCGSLKSIIQVQMYIFPNRESLHSQVTMQITFSILEVDEIPSSFWAIFPENSIFSPNGNEFSSCLKDVWNIKIWNHLVSFGIEESSMTEK